jgi:hypothetical protein
MQGFGQSFANGFSGGINNVSQMMMMQQMRDKIAPSATQQNIKNIDPNLLQKLLGGLGGAITPNWRP